MIVGIHGHMGAGKDEIARVLVEDFGFRRVGFADALKDEVCIRLRQTLLAIAAQRYAYDPRLPLGMTDDRVIALLLRDKPHTVRALLQEYGTDVRRADDPDYWVKAWHLRISPPVAGHIVTPDVRFPNEVAAIRAQGGRLIHVTRPGHGGDAHASEQVLSGPWDWEYVNDRSLADLRAAVTAWMRTVI